jgi:hypothetical protein
MDGPPNQLSYWFHFAENNDEKHLHPELKTLYQMSRSRQAASMMRLLVVFMLLIGGLGIAVALLMGEWEGWLLALGGFGGAVLFHWIKRLTEREQQVRFRVGTELLETVPPLPMSLHFENIRDSKGWIATLSDVSAREEQAPMKVLFQEPPQKPPVGQSEVSVYFKSNPERLLLIRINGKISLARQLY